MACILFDLPVDHVVFLRKQLHNVHSGIDEILECWNKIPDTDRQKSLQSWHNILGSTIKHLEEWEEKDRAVGREIQEKIQRLREQDDASIDEVNKVLTQYTTAVNAYNKSQRK